MRIEEFFDSSVLFGDIGLSKSCFAANDAEFFAKQLDSKNYPQVVPFGAAYSHKGIRG